MAKTNIIGLDKLIVKLDRIDDSVLKGLEKACMRVETTAKELCPVDDGVLRASITHQVTGEEGEIGTNVEYAPFVETGTGIFSATGRKNPWTFQDADGNWYTTAGQEPQPFLEPALVLNKDKISEDIASEIRKGIQK